MFSDSGHWVGAGENRFYFPGNAGIWVGGDPGYVSIDVSGGNLGDSYHLVFAAPPGEDLKPGDYERAQRAPFREAGRPGISVSGSGRGCNKATGRFRVNDIAVAGNGEISTLWVVYEHHCEGAKPAVIGEVRYNVPGDGGSVMINPREVRWPNADVGEAMKVIPVTVVNPGASPVSMGESSISGPASEDFTVRIDGCDGVTLETDDVCQVFVRYVPSTPGQRQATLTIDEGDGTAHLSRLEGFVYGGTTRVLLYSDKGDFIGSGSDYAYTPENSSISLAGSHERVTGSVDTTSGDRWRFDFDAPSGDILAPGSTYAAIRYPFNDSAAGMAFTGNGRACGQITGTFTISAIIVDQFGELRRFGAHFEQHCDGDPGSPALHGIIDFRNDPPTDPGPMSIEVVSREGGSVTSEPEGISCGDDCAESYAYGTNVALTAVPEPGYWFIRWSGACSGTKECLVKATQHRVVEAVFSDQEPEEPEEPEEPPEEPPPVSPTTPKPTTTTLRVAQRQGRFLARGAVRPNRAGKSVRVTLAVKRAGRFVPVARKTAALNTRSRYAVPLARRSARRCRIVARFGGDPGHRPSRAVKRFSC